LKTLDFKMPTPSTEDLYLKSVNTSATQYGLDLTEVQDRSLKLENKDFDTGRVTVAGEYSLTDETYADLLNRLADAHFAQMTPRLQANILAFYQDPKPPAFSSKNPAKWTKTLDDLAQLKAVQVPLVAQK